MRTFLLIFLLIISHRALANPQAYDVGFENQVKIPFKYICKKSNLDFLLVTYKEGVIDCMGTKIALKGICPKKRVKDLRHLTLVKEEISEKEESVKCTFGTSVIMKWNCSGTELCLTPEKSCLKLKKKFARGLALSQSYQLKGILSCHF